MMGFTAHLKAGATFYPSYEKVKNIILQRFINIIIYWDWYNMMKSWIND